MCTRKASFWILTIIVALAGGAACAQVQKPAAYPAKPLRIIVGYSVDSGFGLVGPPHLPGEIVSRLNAETVRGMSAADLREKLARWASSSSRGRRRN